PARAAISNRQPRCFTAIVSVVTLVNPIKTCCRARLGRWQHQGTATAGEADGRVSASPEIGSRTPRISDGSGRSGRCSSGYCSASCCCTSCCCTSCCCTSCCCTSCCCTSCCCTSCCCTSCCCTSCCCTSSGCSRSRGSGGNPGRRTSL